MLSVLGGMIGKANVVRYANIRYVPPCTRTDNARVTKQEMFPSENTCWGNVRCIDGFDSFPLDRGQAYGGTIEELEDAQLQLQTLLSMRHVTPFREIVQVRRSFDVSRRHHKVSNIVQIRTIHGAKFGKMKRTCSVFASFLPELVPGFQARIYGHTHARCKHMFKHVGTGGKLEGQIVVEACWQWLSRVGYMSP